MPIVAPPENATNGQLVRWVFEMLNAGNTGPLKRFWGEDAVERFPDRTCRGPEEIAAYFESMFAALPDFHIEAIALAEQGEDVFVRWRLTGTHRGTLMGVEATGRRIEVDGIDHFVIRDGRMASNFVVADQLQYARQLGMLPADGSAPDRLMKSAFNVRTAVLARLGR